MIYGININNAILFLKKKKFDSLNNEEGKFELWFSS